MLLMLLMLPTGRDWNWDSGKQVAMPRMLQFCEAKAPSRASVQPPAQPEVQVMPSPFLMPDLVARTGSATPWAVTSSASASTVLLRYTPARNKALCCRKLDLS
ncbi:hypothetical protein D9M69_642060 [compost metagenome]